MTRFLIDHKGRVIERDTNEYLGRVEQARPRHWFPVDKWGGVIAGPCQLRERCILTVIRHAGRKATLMDLLEDGG